MGAEASFFPNPLLYGDSAISAGGQVQSANIAAAAAKAQSAAMVQSAQIASQAAQHAADQQLAAVQAQLSQSQGRYNQLSPYLMNALGSGGSSFSGGGTSSSTNGGIGPFAVANGGNTGIMGTTPSGWGSLSLPAGVVPGNAPEQSTGWGLTNTPSVQAMYGNNGGVYTGPGSILPDGSHVPVPPGYTGGTGYPVGKAALAPQPYVSSSGGGVSKPGSWTAGPINAAPPDPNLANVVSDGQGNFTRNGVSVPNPSGGASSTNASSIQANAAPNPYTSGASGGGGNSLQAPPINPYHPTAGGTGSLAAPPAVASPSGGGGGNYGYSVAPAGSAAAPPPSSGPQAPLSQAAYQPNLVSPSSGPVISPDLLNQQINSATAQNTASTGGQIRRQQQDLAGRGVGANSPLFQAIQSQLQGANLGANAQSALGARTNAATLNANYAQAMNQAQIQASAGKYAAAQAAQASMYGANRGAQASEYGSQVGADASRYGSQVSAQSSLAAALRAAQASEYGSQVGATANMYGSQVGAQSQLLSALNAANASTYNAGLGAQASQYGSGLDYLASLNQASTSRQNQLIQSLSGFVNG